MGSARYRKHSSNRLMEHKLKQLQRDSKVPDLNLRAKKTPPHTTLLSKRNLAMHQKQLGESSRSAGSLDRFLKEESHHLADQSHHSSAHTDSTSVGTSVFFEKFIEEHQTALDDARANTNSNQAQSISIDQQVTGGNQNTARKASKTPTKAGTDKHGLGNDLNLDDSTGLRDLGIVTGASRHSLQHAHGVRLRQAAAMASGEVGVSRVHELEHPETSATEGPICRSYPAHHAEELNVVPKTGEAANRSHKLFSVERRFKDVLRQPRSSGYSIHMNITEAKHISAQASARANKEDEPEVNNGKVSGSGKNAKLKNSHSHLPRRSSHASIFGSAGTIDLFSDERRSSTTRSTYVFPKDMQEALKEACTADGSHYHNKKSDISEFNEARVKFEALHSAF